MRRRPSNRLDMLPLLDVFMVVLFVFASIQEDELEASKRESKRLSSDLTQAAEALDQAQARARLQRARERDVAADARAATARPATPRADEARRRQEVLTKLLDHFSVFEIEIAGSLDGEGRVINTCCYRSDLQPAGWNRCGRTPARAAELADWLDDGAGGLVGALRRTKGGNAMTLIRQDATATYRVAGTLEAELRERFPHHKLYNEGVAREQARPPVVGDKPGALVAAPCPSEAGIDAAQVGAPLRPGSPSSPD